VRRNGAKIGVSGGSWGAVNRDAVRDARIAFFPTRACHFGLHVGVGLSELTEA